MHFERALDVGHTRDDVRGIAPRRHRDVDRERAPVGVGRHLDRLHARAELVELPSGSSPAPVIAAIEAVGARVDAIDVTQDADRRELAIDVSVPAGRKGTDVVTRVAEVEGTLEVRWME